MWESAINLLLAENLVLCGNHRDCRMKKKSCLLTKYQAIQQYPEHYQLQSQGTSRCSQAFYDKVATGPKHVMGAKFEESVQYWYYHLRGLNEDECQDNRLHYSACNHPKDINTFGWTRLTDYRQFVQSATTYWVNTNNNNWRIRYSKRFQLRRLRAPSPIELEH